ncbi:RecX family transcriptional regulator [Arachidicoccus ginsenosidimutans]|uniref:regulatory protein RecX n=1 Tax=Arachidicoccus sp. BS20 TaxID=1850526 RepID=UPI0007F13315|nr:regulatory protein RecX [Arachidicoccus sp. BS20]ANI90041.1 RecX family transcriptional regulator [Arachidicoccus sp. BS20]
MNRLTPQQALQKIKSYCAYQERSHQEVKDKLYGFGLYKPEVENILGELIEQNYLNEERFASLFAGGKFRMKQWGKIKIVNELKLKRVSPYNIKIALREINETDYKNTLEKLAAAKWKSLKNEQYINREVKTTRYLLQKGFEIALIKEALQKIRTKQV